MKHEVIHEYEKSKRQIFEKDYNLAKIKDSDQEAGFPTQAPFHPVFLSTLMNQQVFRRECVKYEETLKINTKAEKDE